MNLDDLKILFKTDKKLSKFEPTKIELLKGDASGRKYSRIYLDSKEVPSLILMEVVGGKGPTHSGDYEGNEDLAFLEIGKILRDHDIPAPEVFYSDLEKNLIIVSDAGKYGLNEFCVPEMEFGDFDPNIKDDLFKQSVDILDKLQGVSKQKSAITQRFLSFEDYHRDASSVIDNYLVVHSARPSEIEHVKESINNLCEMITAHPKTVVHRDFMPWNLQVNETGKVFLIDFQDSLIASSEFDIVCLLHDRDIDFQIGDDFIKQIVSYYKEKLNRNDNFKERYYQILLHRYIRLTGHFNLLTKKTGKKVYKDWVPGCLKRLARTVPNVPDLTDLVEILLKYDKSIKAGELKVFSL